MGAVVNVYSRQLKVIDYADEYTKSKFEVQKGKGAIVITPDAYLAAGKIINAAEEQGFTITNLKMAKLSRQEAERVLESGRGKSNFNDLAAHLSSDLVVAVELLTENCISRIQEFVRGIQQKFGSDPIKCAVLGSESAQSAVK